MSAGTWWRLRRAVRRRRLPQRNLVGRERVLPVHDVGGRRPTAAGREVRRVATSAL